MATAAEAAAMRRAIELAAHGLGHTSPNPIVGCVILDADGQPVGEGWHRRAGGPHAEVHALRMAGERAAGGTAVVTLEPCAHTGRTGPCAQALIDARVARVRYAVDDPTPTGAGGRAALTAAGVDVHGGLLADLAAADNEAWLTAVRRRRPHVTWKYAATLDGRVAAADGTSRWITSAPARADTHRLRARVDAVVVGSGTARADDPHLGARPGEDVGGPGAAEAVAAPEALGADPVEALVEPDVTQPLRVVVDTRATAVQPGARLLDGTGPALVAVAEDADVRHLTGLARVLRLPRSPDGRGVLIPALLTALYERGVRAVLLEGGPTLAGAFLRARAVDKVVGYLAPTLLGDGPAALAHAHITTMDQALRLDLKDVVRLGPDLRITAELKEN